MSLVGRKFADGCVDGQKVRRGEVESQGPKIRLLKYFYRVAISTAFNLAVYRRSEADKA